MHGERWFWDPGVVQGAMETFNRAKQGETARLSMKREEQSWK